MLFCHGNLEPWGAVTSISDFFIMVSTLFISFSLLINRPHLSISCYIRDSWPKLFTIITNDLITDDWFLISYWKKTREHEKMTKKTWNKEHDAKTTQKKNKEKNPLLFVLAMIWHRLACTTSCRFWQVILGGRCIRVWSVLISIFEIPAARLGFLFDCILYSFFSCLLFLFLISYTIPDVESPSTTWDERRIILQFFKRPWRSTIFIPLPPGILTFLFCSFLWFFIFRPSAILSKLQSTWGKRHPIIKKKNRKKKARKARALSLLSLFLDFDFQ